MTWLRNGPKGTFTDDTQMTRWLAESVLGASRRAPEAGEQQTDAWHLPSPGEGEGVRVDNARRRSDQMQPDRRGVARGAAGGVSRWEEVVWVLTRLRGPGFGCRRAPGGFALFWLPKRRRS